MLASDFQRTVPPLSHASLSLGAKTAAKLQLFIIQTTKIEYFFQKNLESPVRGSPTVL
jgi:hypothetical protein